MCAACQYGKQVRTTAAGNKTVRVQDTEGSTSRGKLFPGDEICVDHFVCSTKGRLFSSQGRTSDYDMFDGGCIFVDTATGYIDVAFQAHLNSHETIKAKEQFELKCRDYGVVPRSYLSDNGTAFTSAAFTRHLSAFQQVNRFAGVGAHHHNRAERSIRTIMSISRAMLLHAAIHWPAMADSSLWPMAVQHAVFLYNHVPDPRTGISPHDAFTRTRWSQSKFADLHVWGCPVYVLNKRLQDGQKLPKWQPRSTRMVYLGLSHKHASTVPLVLNPNSGKITAQFHVVIDDYFATVSSNVEDLPDFQSEEWYKLFGDSLFQYVFDSDELPEAVDSDPHAASRDRVRDAIDQLLPPTPLPVASMPTVPQRASVPTATTQNVDQTNDTQPSAHQTPASSLPTTEGPSAGAHVPSEGVSSEGADIVSEGAASIPIGVSPATDSTSVPSVPPQRENPEVVPQHQQQTRHSTRSTKGR